VILSARAQELHHSMPKKKPITPNCAMMLVPHKSAWGPLQAMRRLHDGAHRNWPPHITLFRPFERDLDTIAPQVASILGRHAPIVTRFSETQCLNAYGTVVLKPDARAERQISELHLELCNAFPQHVREAWIQNMAKHGKDGKAAFLQHAANDFTTAYSQVFLPHLTVAQKETQAEADALAQQRVGGLEFEVPLEMVLLRREVEDKPMCLEYAFREGHLVHACEMYVPEAAEGKMMTPTPATDVPTPVATASSKLNLSSSLVCICCEGTGVVIVIGVCPLCDGLKVFSR